MSVLLNNALTGLLTAQAGLRTTSNNTANVNTEGYSRQRVDQVALPGQTIGRVSIGNGVVVSGVDRIFDQFLVDQLRDATGLEQRFLAFNELAQRIDGVLGDTESGIGPSIQNFFAQLQTVAHDSTSIVNRQLLISQGSSLEERIHQFAAQIEGVDSEINRRMTDMVSTINSMTSALARLNDQIVAAGDTASNDLLDQRERLLSDLSGLIDVRTLRSADGAVNVLVGNGRPLVLATQSFELDVVQDEFNPARLQIAHVVGSRSEVISRQITGGALGGLLSFRQEALDPAKRALGMIAFGLAETFNEQHARGVDLNGDLGGDFFRSVQPIVTSSSANVGAGVLTATIGNAADVQPRDYVLRFDGVGWQANDANTGALLSMSGTGTALDPFVIEGLEIVVGAPPAAGDQFLIRAVSEAAVAFGVAISDPATIAAANPVATSYDVANVGNATISPAIIEDATNPGLQQAVDIVFDDASSYRIYDAFGTDLTGPLAYTSGADISFNGWRVRISGPAEAGDTFSISATAPGSGDNGNAIALSGIRSRGFFDGGRTSVNDSIGNMIATVGGASLQSSQNLAAQTTLRQQLELDVQNVSGVNLDEEAVNALRYQEAFMASSRLIAMADDLFLSVLNAIGGR
jgi:flagellar hook-associated protein 1 FlgK